MGWFDDSDSEDEERKKRNKRLPLEFFESDPLSPPPPPPTTENVENEDEIDPLDAYMNGVQATVMKQADSTTKSWNDDDNDEDAGGTSSMSMPVSNHRHSNKTRLDVENEDEATAHWTTITTNTSTVHDGIGGEVGAVDSTRFEQQSSSSSSSFQQQQQQQQQQSPLSYESIRAKADMASIFHKANTKTKKHDSNRCNDMSTYGPGGEQQQQQQLQRQRQDDNNYNDSDDDYQSEKRLQKKRTIDPLAKINHDTKNYAPFQKSFWNDDDANDHDHQPSSRSNSSAKSTTTIGKTWRTTNIVQCSIDIEPILAFDEYGAAATTARRRQRQQNHDPTNRPKGEEEMTDEGLLPPEVLTYLSKNGYREPTPVQAQAIPVALSGMDLLVTSQTGSGKTLAYIIPLLTHILAQPHIQPSIDGPIALILTPTRELARQVHLLTKKLLHTVGGTAVAVTGGMGTYEMTKELRKGCEVVVSTPGRFIDMVGGCDGAAGCGKKRRAATNCDRITLVILDEADKMLEMGFESQVGSILQNVRPDRQSWMFSATFGKRIERVAKGWLRDPVRIAVGRTGSSSEHVTQHVLVLPSREAKKQWLIEMYPILAGLGRLIVFVASRAGCDEIADLLRNNNGSTTTNGTTKNTTGLAVDSIHGERHQSDRNAALSKLRKGKLDALVATDVAARGLDITDIMTVCNFDCAKNLDSHVHRVGRAGRLSNKNKDSKGSSNSIHHDNEPQQEQQQQQHKKGAAYTLLTPQNSDFANVLVEAFQREGREVSDELLQLSRRSRHCNNGGGGGRKKWNRTGLGFRDEDDANFNTQPVQQRRQQGLLTSTTNHRHGEDSSSQRTKRSRWGP